MSLTLMWKKQSNLAKSVNMDKLIRNLTIIGVIVMLMVGVLVYNSFDNVDSNLGSVAVTSEYNSTTTPSSGWSDQQINSGWSTLGSVIITGAGTNEFELLSATTTNINLRASSQSTSSIRIVEFPASLGVGTYTFDSLHKNGIYLNVLTAGTGTSTVTFR